MLSPNALLTELRRLARLTANPPELDTLGELSADWMELLGEDLGDDDLRRAVTAHLRSPTGKFWPAPGELLTLAGTNQPRDPGKLKARADRLFPLVVKARSSCPDVERAALHLEHYGVEDPSDQAACIAAVGNWKAWDPGDPNRGGDPRRYDFARRDFLAAFVSCLPEAEAGRLALPAPPPPPKLVALPAPAPEARPERPVAPPAPAPALKVAPEPPPVRRWSQAHAAAGLCAAADVGQEVPADWSHPAAARHTGGFRPAFGGR